MQFRCSKAYKISDEPHEKTCNHTEHDNRSCDNEHLCAYAEKHAFSIVFHCRRHHRVCKSRYRNYRSATCKSADFVVQSERGEQTAEKNHRATLVYSNGFFVYPWNHRSVQIPESFAYTANYAAHNKRPKQCPKHR